MISSHKPRSNIALSSIRYGYQLCAQESMQLRNEFDITVCLNNFSSTHSLDIMIFAPLDCNIDIHKTLLGHDSVGLFKDFFAFKIGFVNVNISCITFLSEIWLKVISS